ncbi:cytochrome b5 [Drosophila grimshawi]|uniref:GH10148 n=1 Tax=Drosophila grimshawi TaxID=7222 RepID=B4JC95_DROGR|nr:cytochrome b5 [Drosophila grimshawi]EDW04128.1 GH10148 [Drosophila grimshawi]
MSSALTNLLQTLRLGPLTPSIKSKPGSDLIMIEKTKAKLEVKLVPEITLEEVAHHDSYDDCWIVIYDRVYDVTHFLREHPGGDDVIMDHAGRDATIAFHGTGHSRHAVEQMRQFLIGELPAAQRIFRTSKHRILSSGIPE